MCETVSMNINKKKVLIYYLSTVAILFYLLNLIGKYDYVSIHILEFSLSFFVIGYISIADYLNNRLFSIRLLFNLFGFLYTNYYIIQLIENNECIDNYTFFAMDMSYLAIYSFNVVYAMSNKKSVVQKRQSTDKINTKVFNAGLLFLFIISIVTEYYVVIEKIGLLNYISVSRAERSLMRSDYSLLLFYGYIIPLVTAISLLMYFEFNKRINFFLFIFAFFIAVCNAIITASRAEMLSVILPVMFLCYIYKKISNKTAVVLGALGFILFGIWKSLYSENIEVQYDSEFNSWYEICKTVLSNPKGVHYILGESYLKTIANLIIPVTGIESLSTWYVKTFEYQVYLIGGGRGFSAVLEAYLNFGLPGIVLIYGFYGWLAQKVKPDNIARILLCIIVISSINMLFRAESLSFWKNMMWCEIYPIFILYFFSTKIRFR